MRLKITLAFLKVSLRVFICWIFVLFWVYLGFASSPLLRISHSNLLFCYLIRPEKVIERTPRTPSVSYSTLKCTSVLHTRFIHNRLSPPIGSISSNVTKTYRCLTNSYHITTLIEIIFI